MTKRHIIAFQKEILDWYSHHHRDLPWRQVLYDTRLKQRDPYKILVSEVMLQQTQVSRVIPKYEAWLKAFPTVESLAKASTRDVLLYWSGLGYNRRALYLQKLAQNLVHSYSLTVHGKKQIVWPQTEKELSKLPGIGEYTARALLCFAFNKQVAVVDTNIRKVILTKFQIPSTKSQINHKNQNSNEIATGLTPLTSAMTDKEIQQIADHLLPKGKAYEWNQALMDYASAMLKEHKIPIPRQSKFKDSDRFYRGLILRILLKNKQLEFEKLFEIINQTQKIEKARYQRILQKLEKDGMVIKKKNAFKLPA